MDKVGISVLKRFIMGVFVFVAGGVCLSSCATITFGTIGIYGGNGGIIREYRDVVLENVEVKGNGMLIFHDSSGSKHAVSGGIVLVDYGQTHYVSGMYLENAGSVKPESDKEAERRHEEAREKKVLEKRDRLIEKYDNLERQISHLKDNRPDTEENRTFIKSLKKKQDRLNHMLFYFYDYDVLVR